MPNFGFLELSGASLDTCKDDIHTRTLQYALLIVHCIWEG